MPLIVISISTLNDIGGSVCTSLLAVCFARWNQAHQTVLSADTSPSSPAYNQMLNSLKGAYLAQGFDAATASTKAIATLCGSVRLKLARCVSRVPFG